MKHLYNYIGENYPYLFPMDNLVKNASTVEYSTTNSSDSQLRGFKEIGQIVASLGSISLLTAMDISSKTFFLAEKIRIRKINSTIVEDGLKYCAKPFSFSKRKGKVLVDVLNNQNQLFYTSELEYVIFDENAFNDVFSSFYTEKIPAESSPIKEDVLVNLIEPFYFKIQIPSFTIEQCKGHFDNYPIVPGVFIMDRLLEGIEKFFKLQGEDVQSKKLVLDNLETFLNTATPVYSELSSLVHYRQVSKDSYLFVCTITDSNHKIEYGHFVITVKLY